LDGGWFSESSSCDFCQDIVREGGFFKAGDWFGDALTGDMDVTFAAVSFDLGVRTS